MGVASLVVNPAGTSRACTRCGHCAAENRVAQGGFRCTACGHTAHADVNAAVNSLRAGLALRQAAEAAWREAAPLRERRSHGVIVTWDRSVRKSQPSRRLLANFSVREVAGAVLRSGQGP
ncbi:zinc ribbon domain-containing protein [Nonomuraea sp. NPDC049714]|uniref:zinc ribbon domain-containing protein n=1 Tax=Nonomuraea sp. NPDC049714 TaxID=3364357 RepID=UPI0037885157